MPFGREKNLLNEEYNIPLAIVFCQDNVQVNEKVIYKFDLTGL